MGTTSTTITVSILPSTDDGGSSITNYELYRDDGSMGPLTNVVAYDGISSTYVFDTAIDPTLTTGLIYRFQVKAQNAKGYSDFSGIASAAMANLPD